MKKITLFLIIVTQFCNAQSYKMEIVGSTTESVQGLRVELKNPTSINDFGAALRAYNNNPGSGWGIRAGSASVNGSGVQGTSTLGYGVTGYTGAPSIYGLFFPYTGTTTNSGILGLGSGSFMGVKGYSEDGIGGFFASNTGDIPLIVKKIPELNTGVTNSLFFQTGDVYSGAIKTIGTGLDFARLGFFTFSGYAPNVLLERMSITDNGKVGVGLISPNELLDINGRTRIRHNGNTAGIWMSNSTNSLSDADGAFYGMKNNTESGIYIGNAWRFWVNNAGVTNTTGGISVGGGETIAKVMKKSVLIDLPSIPGNTSTNLNVNVLGVSVGDNVIFNPAQILGSLTINSYTILNADFVSIYVTNNSNIAYDAPSMNFNFTVFK